MLIAVSIAYRRLDGGAPPDDIKVGRTSFSISICVIRMINGKVLATSLAFALLATPAFAR
jgi:hypothetical protein